MIQDIREKSTLTAVEPHLHPTIYRSLLDYANDAICLVNPTDWRVVYANRAAASWADPAASGPAGASIFDWFPSSDRDAMREKLDQTARDQGEHSAFTAYLHDQVGDVFPIEVRTRPLEHEGRRLLAVAIRPAPAEIGVAGFRRDPLTGLADRAFFQERLATLLGGERDSDHRCAVLFVDVDGFKQINDDHGHLVGDRVLCEVARRLAGCVRADDIVARFGGDEFVVLLELVRGPEEIEPVAERIRVAFERPIALASGEVKLAVSVGAAEAGPDERSIEALIHAADRAMYAAKRAMA